MVNILTHISIALTLQRNPVQRVPYFYSMKTLETIIVSELSPSTPAVTVTLFNHPKRAGVGCHGLCPDDNT